MEVNPIMAFKKASEAQPKRSAAANGKATAVKKSRAASTKGDPVDRKREQAPRPLGGDEVAMRAYFFWLERDGRDGSAEQDWLRAEQELHARR
jgi:hypothetical protein